ncbi:MAG: PilZ domain-containing protein [Planctomycetota bacterium]|nr:PilZ domain-containing protein [Planctomycetota bacterium]
MPPRRLHAQERRRDRRIPVAARVRIEPRVGAGVVQAELVDVSAGGLRAHCPLPRTLEAGSEVDVEITVQDASDARRQPLVNLRGRGEVVRVHADGDHYDTALRFTGALALREPFSQMLLF